MVLDCSGAMSTNVPGIIQAKYNQNPWAEFVFTLLSIFKVTPRGCGILRTPWITCVCYIVSARGCTCVLSSIYVFWTPVYTLRYVSSWAHQPASHKTKVNTRVFLPFFSEKMKIGAPPKTKKKEKPSAMTPPGTCRMKCTHVQQYTRFGTLLVSEALHPSGRRRTKRDKAVSRCVRNTAVRFPARRLKSCQKLQRHLFLHLVHPM